MKFSKVLFSLSLGLLFLYGCGPKHKAVPIPPPATEETVKKIPDDWQNPPNDPNYIYGQGTAVSRDLQVAMDKAKESGRFEIAKTIETRFQGLSKRFQEELGVGMDSEILDQFTQTTKSVVSQVLVGSKIYKSWPMEESGVYRMYILMELPIGVANQALMDRIKANQNMHTLFRSTQAFKDLEDEVNKFEQFKEQQSQPAPGQ